MALDGPDPCPSHGNLRHRPMLILDATLSDLPQIAAIYDHEVRTSTCTFDTHLRNARQQAAWFDVHRSPSYPLLVAKEGERVLAWATLSPWSDRGAYARTVEGSLFVQAAHRRGGVGRGLLTALVDRAREAGHGVLLGRVEASNEASRRMLVGAGFVSVGVMHRVGEKFGRLLDVEILELML